jgi:hypothetical protein
MRDTGLHFGDVEAVGITAVTDGATVAVGTGVCFLDAAGVALGR